MYSLIKFYQKGLLDYPRENHFKFYKKLVIQHINAGWVSFLRGNLDQSIKYINDAEVYTDPLSVIYKTDLDAAEIVGAFHNIQVEICYQIYHKDTSIFSNSSCAYFFPELNQEENYIHTNQIAKKSNNPVDKTSGFFGDYYLNDTLRFNSQFVSDSLSINYFKKTKEQFLTRLSYKSFLEIFRETGLINDNEDTLIIRIDLYNKANTAFRECVAVYTSCSEFGSTHYLNLFINMELPFSRYDISFFIPIILKPEKRNNWNKMDRITPNNDHCLIEYEQLKPTKLD